MTKWKTFIPFVETASSSSNGGASLACRHAARRRTTVEFRNWIPFIQWRWKAHRSKIFAHCWLDFSPKVHMSWICLHQILRASRNSLWKALWDRPWRLRRSSTTLILAPPPCCVVPVGKSNLGCCKICVWTAPSALWEEKSCLVISLPLLSFLITTFRCKIWPLYPTTTKTTSESVANPLDLWNCCYFEHRRMYGYVHIAIGKEMSSMRN